MNRLMYRRQFLLSRKPIATLNEWKTLNICDYFLHIHPDLDVSQVVDSQKSIIILGNIFDFKHPHRDNGSILKDLFRTTVNIRQLYLSIKDYSGSYVIIYYDCNEFVIFSDARAVQEVYYCTNSNTILCGSQPNLIAEFSEPKIYPQSDSLFNDFYKIYLWDSRWVGDETYYENIKHLLPNHCFDVNKNEMRRYWPNEAIKTLKLEEAVDKISNYLEGTMKAIVKRFPTMMAVTSGSDSRVLLAASKKVLNNIHCFINNRDLGIDSPDIDIPRRIFKKIGMDFHIYEIDDYVDEGFRKIYFNNTFLATERLLPAIYNVFYKKHSDKVLILGVGEIGRTFFGLQPKKLNGHRMAYKLGYPKCQYAINQLEKYLTHMLPVAKEYNINAMIILYWEQRLGNWGATRNSESKIAIDKIDPFNSHLINEIFLGVDEKYKDYQVSICVLFKEIVKKLWPELLFFPVNSPSSIRDKIKKLSIQLRIFEKVKEIKYQLSYLKSVISG